MSGGEVHGNSQASPLDWSQPPCVADGPENYIRKLLAPVTGENGEGMDTFQAQTGQVEQHKHQSLLHKVLKWSGIAFAVFMGGSILKKAVIDYMEPAAKKGLEKAASTVAEETGKAAKKASTVAK